MEASDIRGKEHRGHNKEVHEKGETWLLSGGLQKQTEGCHRPLCPLRTPLLICASNKQTNKTNKHRACEKLHLLHESLNRSYEKSQSTHRMSSVVLSPRSCLVIKFIFTNDKHTSRSYNSVYRNILS